MRQRRGSRESERTEDEKEEDVADGEEEKLAVEKARDALLPRMAGSKGGMVLDSTLFQKERVVEILTATPACATFSPQNFG